MENTTTQRIHWRVGSDRDDNLRRIIIGIEKTLEITRDYDQKTDGGILDGDEELESILGLALIAMQNYINMTCIDCFLINGLSNKKDLVDYSQKIRKSALIIPHYEYSFVELIYTLANAIKHRNELELQCERILMSHDSDNQKYAIEKSYEGQNLVILNTFNLLTPLRSTSEAWEIYPIIKGMEILDHDYNLYNIVDKLVVWARKVKRDANERANRSSKD